MANLVMDGVTLASKSGGVVTIQNTNVNLDANITGNATFPAGHVIQTIVDTDTGTHRNTSTQTAWTVDVPGLSCAITSKQANSNFLITAHSGMALASGDSGRLQVDIKRAITEGTTTAGIVSADANGSDNYGWIHDRSSTWSSTNGTHMDVLSELAGTIITYSLVFRSGGGGQIYWLHESSLALLMVQEIAG